MNPLLEAYKTHIGGETFLGQPVDLHDPGTLVTSQFYVAWIAKNDEQPATCPIKITIALW